MNFSFESGSSVNSSGQNSENSEVSIPETHITETTESSAKPWGALDIDELIKISEEKLSRALVHKVNAIYEFHLEGDNVNVFYLNLKHGKYPCLLVNLFLHNSLILLNLKVLATTQC